MVKIIKKNIYIKNKLFKFHQNLIFSQVLLFFKDLKKE
jgi:hypothetical protein